MVFQFLVQEWQCHLLLRGKNYSSFLSWKRYHYSVKLVKKKKSSDKICTLSIIPPTLSTDNWVFNIPIGRGSSLVQIFYSLWLCPCSHPILWFKVVLNRTVVCNWVPPNNKLIVVWLSKGSVEATTSLCHFYPARACMKGLSDRFCPSVSQSVCPVKNFEISTFTGLNNCCMRWWHGNRKKK